MLTFTQFMEAQTPGSVLNHFGYTKQADGSWHHRKLGSIVNTSGTTDWSHQGHSGKSAKSLESHLTAVHQDTMLGVPRALTSPKKASTKQTTTPTVKSSPSPTERSLFD